MSEPLKRMLTSGMIESQTRQIQMSSFTTSQVRFTLRLAYTGRVDPHDWGASTYADQNEEQANRSATRRRTAGAFGDPAPESRLFGTRGIGSVSLAPTGPGPA